MFETSIDMMEKCALKAKGDVHFSRDFVKRDKRQREIQMWTQLSSVLEMLLAIFAASL